MTGPRHPLRLAAAILAGCLGVLAGVYVLAVVLVGSGIPSGTRVAGVDIGGMTAAAAQAKLAAQVPHALPDKLTLAAADRTFDLVPAQSGLAIDAAATVKTARADTKSPSVALRALFGQTHNVAPVLTTDVGRLTAVLEEIGGLVRQQKVEGGLVFLDGVASAVEPVPGRALDVAATVPVVEAAWRSDRVAVEGVLAVENPEISKEAVAQALAEFGTKAMAAPVTVKVGESSVIVTQAQLGKYLTMVSADGELKPVLDGEGLAAELLESSTDLGARAQDAKFAFKKGKPTVVPSRAGTTIDPAKLGATVLEVLTVDGPREVVAEVAVRDPKFTTADAEGLGITEKLSSFRTQYPYAAYRVTNIGRAARLIDGSLVKPGETWSLNKRVGQRTKANGFVRGFIIKGEKFVEDIGGGVSQSATTTFNAAFFAGLEDVEHHPHSLYIGRYPAGREATVAWPAKDLRFKNDSSYGVLIQAVHRVGLIEVTFWGTKVWDRIDSYSSPRRNVRPWTTIESDEPKCLAQLPEEGFDITVTRAFIKAGVEVRRERFNTSYAATNKILCTKNGQKATATPSPQPSVHGKKGDPKRDVRGDATATPVPSLEPDFEVGGDGEADGAGGGGGSETDVAALPTPAPTPEPDVPAASPPRTSKPTPTAGRRVRHARRP